MFQYAISEIINFFKTSDLNIEKLLTIIGCQMSSIKEKAFNIASAIPSRQKRINLKMDLKGPYIVIPQHGSAQKCVRLNRVHIILNDSANRPRIPKFNLTNRNFQRRKPASAGYRTNNSQKRVTSCKRTTRRCDYDGT